MGWPCMVCMQAGVVKRRAPAAEHVLHHQRHEQPPDHLMAARLRKIKRNRVAACRKVLHCVLILCIHSSTHVSPLTLVCLMVVLCA